MEQGDAEREVLARIDREREAHLQLLQALVRLPSIAGKEDFAQELVIDRMRRLGGSLDVFAPDPELVKSHPEYTPLSDDEWVQAATARNVAVRFAGSDGARSLVAYAHIDTEPVHQPEAWIHPPFDPYIDGNRMYGLGTADAKSAVAVLLAAAEALNHAGVRLGGDLTILSLLGKRGGGAGTLSAFLRGYRGDGCVYCHSPETGHKLGELKLSTAGMIQFRIVLEGFVPEPWEVNTPDTSPVHLGVNPIEKAAVVIQELKGLGERRSERIGLAEDGFPKSTLNVGMIRSGRTPGSIPESCELHARISFLDGETVETVRQEVEECLAGLSKTDAWLRDHPPYFELVGLRSNPASIPSDHPIAETVRSSLRDVGATPSRHYRHAASDIRIPILYANTPTVGFGPLGGGFYGPNEWVDIEEYLGSIKAAALTFLRWCGAS